MKQSNSREKGQEGIDKREGRKHTNNLAVSQSNEAARKSNNKTEFEERIIKRREYRRIIKTITK